MLTGQNRQNVRNYLVGLTVAEMLVEWNLSIDMGMHDRAETINEYIEEVELEG